MKSVLRMGMLGLFVAGLNGWAQGPHNPSHQFLSFKNDTLHVRYQFTAQPEVLKEAVLDLTTMDTATHQPVEIAETLEVSLWMPAHGHEHGSAPVEIEKVKGSVGAYRATSIYFTMGGRWEVRVDLKSAQGDLIERQVFMVVLPEGGGGGHHGHQGHH